MSKPEDKKAEPYVNKELDKLFGIHQANLEPNVKSHNKSNTNLSHKNSNKFHKLHTLQTIDKVYWSIPLSIFIFILVTGIEDDPSMSGMSEILSTILAAIIIAILLIVLFGIPYWIYKRIVKTKYTVSKKAALPKREPKKASYITWSIIIVTTLLFSLAYKPATNFFELRSLSSRASDSINTIANSSGFNDSGKLIFYRTNPELLDANELSIKCPNENISAIEFGCYDPNTNKIYLLLITDLGYEGIQYTTAAHETLHAAYANLDSTERESINSFIKTFYEDTSNPEVAKLQESIKNYSKDDDVINELHSFIGSETINLSSNPQLSKYYSKYFSDRAVPVNALLSFNRKIDSETAALNAESQRLDRVLAEITTYKSQHLDNIEAAMNKSYYYGDIYAYNRNVDAYNQNLVYYNSQVDSLKNQINSFNQDVESFNFILRTFSPTEKLLNTHPG